MKKGASVFLEYLRKRLREKSTAAGITALLAAFGVVVDAVTVSQVLPLIGAALVLLPTSGE